MRQTAFFDWLPFPRADAVSQAYHVENEDGVAIRGLFIIDPDGVIQHATINNAPIGRNVDETLRLLAAVKYVRDNPDEVCPAGALELRTLFIVILQSAL